MYSFKYKPLSFQDLPLLHYWYHLKHVIKWYSKGALEYAQLENKYRPYILGKNHICGFVCYVKEGDRAYVPLGYIQYYPVKHYIWDEHDLEYKLEDCAGIDAFIGDMSFLGKGLGRRMITRFIQKHVWGKYLHCLVDPHMRNKKAIKCYEACGFSVHKKILEDKEPHYLMIKSSISRYKKCGSF